MKTSLQKVIGIEIDFQNLVPASRKIEHLDWRKIASIDLDKLILDEDKSILLQEILPQLIHCQAELEFESITSSDLGFRKVFQLSQLTIEALLGKLHEIGSKYMSMETKFTELTLQIREKESELAKLREKLEFAKKELKNRKELIASTQKEILGGNLDEYEQCTYCSKRFLAPIYLLSHIQRRHQGLALPKSITSATLTVAPVQLEISKSTFATQTEPGTNNNDMSSFQQFLNEQQRRHLSPEREIPLRRRRSAEEAEARLLEKAGEVETRWRTVLEKLHISKEDELSEKRICEEINKLKLAKENEKHTIDKEIQWTDSPHKSEQTSIVFKVDKESQWSSPPKIDKKSLVKKEDKEVQWSSPPKMDKIALVPKEDKEVQWILPPKATEESRTQALEKQDEDVQWSHLPVPPEGGIQKLQETLQQRQGEIDKLRELVEKKSEESVEVLQQKLETTEKAWEQKTQQIGIEYGTEMERMKSEFKNALAVMEQQTLVKEIQSRKPNLIRASTTPIEENGNEIPIPKPRNMPKVKVPEKFGKPAISPTHHEYEEPINVQQEYQVFEYSNSISSSFLESDSSDSMTTLTEGKGQNEPQAFTEIDQVRTKVLKDLDDQMTSLGISPKIKNSELLEKDMSKVLGRLKKTRKSLEMGVDNFAIERVHLNQEASSVAKRKVLEDQLNSPGFPKSRRLNLVNSTAKKSPLTKMYQGLKKKGTSLKLMLQRKNSGSKKQFKNRNPSKLKTLFSKTPKTPAQEDDAEESDDLEEISDDDDFVMPMITKSRPIFEPPTTSLRKTQSAMVASDSEGTGSSTSQAKQRRLSWKNSELQRQAQEAIELSKIPVTLSSKSSTPKKPVRRNLRSEFESSTTKSRRVLESSSSMASPNIHLGKTNADVGTGNYVQLVKPPGGNRYEDTDSLREVNEFTKDKPRPASASEMSEGEGAGDQKFPTPKPKDSDTSARSGWDSSSYAPPQGAKLNFQNNKPSTSGTKTPMPPTLKNVFLVKNAGSPTADKKTPPKKMMLSSWDSDSDRLI